MRRERIKCCVQYILIQHSVVRTYDLGPHLAAPLHLQPEVTSLGARVAVGHENPARCSVRA